MHPLRQMPEGLPDGSGSQQQFPQTQERHGMYPLPKMQTGMPRESAEITYINFEKEVVPIIPMGKLIQPEDIADTILFLASEKARLITGQVIKVSGGHAL